MNAPEVPPPVRCACGDTSTWSKPVFGAGGTPAVSLVWQGCANPTHIGQALGAPLRLAAFRKLARQGALP